MRNIELNEKQLKTLKLFSYYVKSHGCEEGYAEVYLYGYGDYDSSGFENWYCGDSHDRIESYDTVNEVMKYIFDKLDYEEYMDDSDNSGSLRFEIDFKEKTIDVHLYENVKTSNETGRSYEDEEIEENEDLKSFFIRMRDEGIRNGYVQFDGGGDSGQIEDYLVIEGDNVDLPAGVTDWLYNSLEGFYGGWEINEGSHGRFEFDFENKEIVLDFNEHREDSRDCGKIFHVDF